MSLFELALIAIGLSMDAFAVAVCKGLGMRGINLHVTLVLALFFGGFQALMPLIGWALGSRLLTIIGPFDHWVAFALLLCIGGKMIIEALSNTADNNPGATDHVDLKEFFLLALATSIDALAVGISFAALAVKIVPSVVLIACVTFGFTVAGVFVGNLFGARYERSASIVGGVVLILIGVKIILEHLGVISLGF